LIDLTLADSDKILPDTDYVGRVVSARLIIPNSELTDKVFKIDLCIEILEGDQRIGALNDNLFLSPRCLRRLKEFLLSAGLEREANSKALDAGALCDILPGRLVTLNTTERYVSRTGEKAVIVASYICWGNRNGGNVSYTLESVFSDLLISEIDESQNLLGNRWLERGTFGLMTGSSGVGKSVAATQGGIQTAAGLPFFGIKPPRPLRVLIVQSEDSRNDRIDQVQCARLLVPIEKHKETDKNLFIYTTTDERGEVLFDRLEDISTNTKSRRLTFTFLIRPLPSFLTVPRSRIPRTLIFSFAAYCNPF
jgi:AAA domain